MTLFEPFWQKGPKTIMILRGFEPVGQIGHQCSPFWRAQIVILPYKGFFGHFGHFGDQRIQNGHFGQKWSKSGPKWSKTPILTTNPPFCLYLSGGDTHVTPILAFWASTALQYCTALGHYSTALHYCLARARARARNDFNAIIPDLTKRIWAVLRR